MKWSLPAFSVISLVLLIFWPSAPVYSPCARYKVLPSSVQVLCQRQGDCKGSAVRWVGVVPRSHCRWRKRRRSPRTSGALPNAHLPVMGLIHPENEDASWQSGWEHLAGICNAQYSGLLFLLQVTRTAPPGRLYLMPSTRLNTSRQISASPPHHAKSSQSRCKRHCFSGQGGQALSGSPPACARRSGRCGRSIADCSSHEVRIQERSGGPASRQRADQPGSSRRPPGCLATVPASSAK